MKLKLVDKENFSPGTVTDASSMERMSPVKKNNNHFNNDCSNDYSRYGQMRVAESESPIEHNDNDTEVQPEKNGVHDNSSDQFSEASDMSTHCSMEEGIIQINVSGGVFEVQSETLEKYPDTLLGSYSDRRRYFLEDRQEYFLERNRLIFGSILYFYQSQGRLYRPTCVTEEQYLEEIRFFKLEKEYKAFMSIDDSMDDKPEDLGPVTILNRFWAFFEDPQSSFPARIWAVANVLAITIAVAIFIIETIPSIKHDIESPEPNWKKLTFFITETVCIVFFTFELVARFITCPNKFTFLKTAMNWIDFVTILPYYIEFTAENDQGQALVVLRVLRVIRVLKLARHSKGIIIVTKTLAASVNELALLLFFWFIGVIIFGSIMYYIEFTETSKFSSILQSSWWAIVTMSTVGYGDMVPETPWGKLVASVCMMFSMIVIALPVTVIVSKFTRVYAKYKDKI